jgi:hypothetical protein
VMDHSPITAIIGLVMIIATVIVFNIFKKSP